MRTKSVAAAVVLAGTTLALFAALGRQAEAATPLPATSLAQTPVGTLNCLKKIVTQACTSCAEAGTMDIECKSGKDFKTCSKTSGECSNGVTCDKHVGHNRCE